MEEDVGVSRVELAIGLLLHGSHLEFLEGQARGEGGGVYSTYVANYQLVCGIAS